MSPLRLPLLSVVAKSAHCLVFDRSAVSLLPSICADKRVKEKESQRPHNDRHAPFKETGKGERQNRLRADADGPLLETDAVHTELTTHFGRESNAPSLGPYEVARHE